MATKILMNVCDGEECRIAVIENGILQEYFVDRPSQLTHVGDVYRGVVTNVESAIQAAFVDLGYRKNAFLHVSDVISAYQRPVKLADLYGRSPVEIIPVEDIDFDTAPEREVVLDDDEDEDGNSGGGHGHGNPGNGQVDSIDAPAIVAKSDFEQSRDEFAIQQTVARERGSVAIDDPYDPGQLLSRSDLAAGTDGPHAEDEENGGEAGPDAAESEAGLSPEEIEERRKAEERRRKGLRRKLKLRDKLAGDRERGGNGGSSDSGQHRAVRETAEAAAPRADEVPGAGKIRLARPARQAEAAPAPAPAPVPARPLPPRPEISGIPVESKAAPRFKVSQPIRAGKATAPDAEAPRKAPPPPRHSMPVPESAPAVESKAAPRLKLNIVRKATPAAGPTAPAEAPAETPAAPEPDTGTSGTGESSPAGFPPAEFHGMDGFGSGALAMAERSATHPRGMRANAMNDGRRFRFMPQPKLQGVLHRGQEMLVQVTRAAQGGKGPSVTTYLSLPGRYMVLMPNTSKCGVSRKIQDHKTRQELRRALRRLRIPEGMGIIIRTAAAGRPIEELQRDLNYLLRIWNDIIADLNSGRPGPSCSYRDSDPAVRTVRDYFTKDVSEIVIDDREVYDRVVAFFDALMPDYRDRVRFYDGGVPLFAREGIEPQIEHIFDKKVPLPSGGYLFVEQTEALVAIDVNSGRFTSESSAEETAYKTNLEAVPEIVRQLRLRDLGGIVVGDFIDMMEARHRREVEERLKEELRRGRARVKVATTSPFGLIEMTRQRVRPSIRVYTYTECPTCKGFGHVMGAETQALRLIRSVRLALASDESIGCVVAAPAEVLSYLHSHMRPHLHRVEARYGKTIAFEWDPTLASEELKLWFINRRGDKAVYNLPGELNKLATSRQLAGFDTGGTGRRRRSGVRRGGRRDTDSPEATDAPADGKPDHAVEQADVEIVDFDRRGERRSGDRSHPRDARRPRPEQRSQPQRAGDALDAHMDGAEREERRDERRDGRRGRRRGRGPGEDAPRTHAPASSDAKPAREAPAGADGQPDAEGGPDDATESGQNGLGRRRRGRRGGRRHRRGGPHADTPVNASDTPGDAAQYGSIDDVASQENQHEFRITGEDTTDIRQSILAEVEYGNGESNPGDPVDTTHRLHVSVQAGASSDVADDRLSEMERHLTVVAAAVPLGLIKGDSLAGLKSALSELAELTDASTGDDEAPSAEIVAELRDARERVANAVARAYQSLPKSKADELHASVNPDQLEQAFGDLLAALLAPSHADADEAVDMKDAEAPVAKKSKKAAKKAAKKAPASVAKKAPARKAAPKKAAAKKAPVKKATTKRVTKVSAKKATKKTGSGDE